MDAERFKERLENLATLLESLAQADADRVAQGGGMRSRDWEKGRSIGFATAAKWIREEVEIAL